VKMSQNTRTKTSAYFADMNSEANLNKFNEVFAKEAKAKYKKSLMDLSDDEAFNAMDCALKDPHFVGIMRKYGVISHDFRTGRITLA
jgi:hypothetical protein